MTKKSAAGRRGRQAQLSDGEASCLLQQPAAAASISAMMQRNSKLGSAAAGYGDPAGSAAASIPLLAGRPAYEMPPSYETACGGLAERLMSADSAVCTITASNPSTAAVAFRTYPTIPDRRLSVDPVYQNNALQVRLVTTLSGVLDHIA